jgi:hypothetical protein
MDGYTKINIGGKDVGIRFSYAAVREFWEKAAEPEGKYWIVKSGGFTSDGFGKVLHLAYLSNCEVRDVEPTLKWADFIEWGELHNSSDSKEIDRVMKVYLESSTVKSLMEAIEEDKKKAAEQMTSQQEQTETISTESSTENSASSPGNSTE